MRRMMLATVIAILVAGCGELQTLLSPIDIRIPPDVQPRMTASEVQAVALARIAEMERELGGALRPARVVRLTASTSLGRIIWTVDAEGTFGGFGGPAPGHQIGPVATGHFEILDSDGSIIGSSFP